MEEIFVQPSELESARALWKKVATENDWGSDPFYVQVWVDDTGLVQDSVAFKGMDHDIVLLEEEDEDEEEH